jgi:predicted DCC family thiol-disulfide oxidoreductase YuxK
MCSAAADWLTPRTTIELTPLQGYQIEDGPSEEELLREIHLVDDAGRYWAGSLALALALQESPKSVWRVVGRAMQLPLISHMAELSYRAVAKSRRRVAT